MKLITQSRASKYRKLKNVSFPIIRQFDNVFYSKVFSFLKALHSLKILSFNAVSTLNQEATLQILADLTQLSQLKAIDINIKGHDPTYFEILSKGFSKFEDLRLLCLQFGKITPRNIQELLLKKSLSITTQLNTISHLDLELYYNSACKSLFEQFLSGLENLKNLVSLSLTIDRHKSSFQDAINLPVVHQSVLKKIKYLNLEAGKQGMGFDLAKYFLGNITELRTCYLKNIELGGKSVDKERIEDLSSLLIRNSELKELKIVYQKEFVRSALENLFKDIKTFKKLQLFSLQLHNQETLDLNMECLINMIKLLENADTIVIEVLFPIKMKGPLLNRLVDNLVKLKRLSGIKIDLRLEEETKCSSLRKLFQIDQLDVITFIVEGMRLSKDDQIYIKEASKKLKKIVSCLVECEDFKFERNF